MKKYYLLTIILGVTTICFGQKNNFINGFTINIQPQIAFPLGSLKQTHGVNLGGHISYERPFKQNNDKRFLIQLGGGTIAGKKYEESGAEFKYRSIILSQLRTGIKFFPGGAGSGFFVSGIVGGVLGIINDEAKMGYSGRAMIGLEFGNVFFNDISIGVDHSAFKDLKVSGFVISIGYGL